MARSVEQLGIIICFVAVACVTAGAEADDSNDGAADARQFISVGDYRIRTLEPGDYSMASTYVGLDVATGLPLYTSVVGLDPDGSARRERRRYVEAFNDTMNAHIRQDGLPSSSRKKWVDELNQPARSFRAKVLLARKPSEAQMVELLPGGHSAASPDGRFNMKIATVQERHGEREVPVVRLIIVTGQREVESIPWDHGKVEMFWGPDGSDTAYLHWLETREQKKLEFHGSLDLRVGGWIKKQAVKHASDAQ